MLQQMQESTLRLTLQMDKASDTQNISFFSPNDIVFYDAT